ncbi:MAG: High-affinity branched-chain amino acid transport system permease protein LivH [Acidimicrobiales bacterium]|nr:MAG: branched-chain amino acid ABC transporter permease [Actinomycetota bacterium]MBV6509808.1 High-affinity branched-chain amino acid transport system permease protein LivH [Acidimicrobiales bacterium]RIK04407.1 MAG: hypothetical protein DCC48_13595 [Acidobacteriota bacterium]
MEDLVLVLRVGLVEGSVLALIAFGYSLIFATTRVVNFAQGALVLVGGMAYLQFADAAFTEVPVWLAAILAIAVAAAAGAAVYAVAILPLGRFNPTVDIGWIITTFAIGAILMELVARRYGTLSYPVPPIIASVNGWEGSSVAEVPVSVEQVTLVLGTLGLLAVLELFHHKTIYGRAFRAVAQDSQMASMLGISVRRMVVLSFVLAGALAAVAALLVGPLINVGPLPFQLFGIQAFIAVVLGGLGSTRGAIVGAYIVGLLAAFLQVVLGWTDYVQFIVFGVFLVVLAVRPTGIFGEPLVEKV